MKNLSIGLLVASAILVVSPAVAAKKSSMVNIAVAKEAWNTKPRAKETTAAFETRLKKEINELLKVDLTSVDQESAKWKLLSYVREMPWDEVTPKWRDWYLRTQPNPRMTEAQRKSYLDSIDKKPIHKMTPKELDAYLGHVHKTIPGLRERVMHYARKNLGQPYQIYLLGEFPYELYDSQPMYCLDKGDCVVFSEHMYAMALSRDWAEFFRNLMRVRYKNGEVGMLTRNHYTEADWDKNNSWLVRDITTDSGATSITAYREKIDRAKFFQKFGIGGDIPVQFLDDSYIPADAIESVLPKLRDGDFVNVVRGTGAAAYVGHTGLIGHKPDGTVTFIHSTPPRSTEQPLIEYVKSNVEKNPERAKKGNAQFLGMKFLQLRAEELQSGDTSTTQSASR